MSDKPTAPRPLYKARLLNAVTPNDNVGLIHANTLVEIVRYGVMSNGGQRALVRTAAGTQFWTIEPNLIYLPTEETDHD